MGEVSQSIFKLKSDWLSYEDQRYALTALNTTDYDTLFLQFARQTGKSTILSVRQTVPSITFPEFETLYVSPSQKQTRVFSQTRVEALIRGSDFVTKNFIDKKCLRGTETKSFSNGSRMEFRYAFYTADSIRGVSAQLLLIDEIQDILWDNVPVIEQVLAHAKPPKSHPEWRPFFKKKIYSGTPKSMQNTMQYTWERSTQCIWVVYCSACNQWNSFDERSIGKFGTICSGTRHAEGGKYIRCSRPIDPRTGMWHMLRPFDKDGNRTTTLGLQVSQLMCPRMEWGPHGWINWKTDILDYQEKYGRVRFHNEVLALPCDDSSRALVESDIRACCDERWEWHSGPDKITNSMVLWAGVDWGETQSKTVLTIGGYPQDARFTPVFCKQFTADEAADPNQLVRDILKYCALFNVQGIGCDVGHGWGLNSQLCEQYGTERVFPIRYASQGTAPRLTFGGRAKWEWRANRSQIMGEFFRDVKRKRVRFPKWSMFETPYSKDLLAVTIDYVGRNREMMVYSHSPDEPDDTCHSIIYARTAAELGMQGSMLWSHWDGGSEN